MKGLGKLLKFWRFYNILQRKEFEQADQELTILQQDIKTARTFLKSRTPSLWRRHRNLPKYIIIGASRSGKTTLLSRSGLELLDTHSDPLKDVVPTKYCSWWFAPQAIYLDTAGVYTKPDIERPRDEIVWIGFLNQLQKYFGDNFVQGAIVVLDLPQLSTNATLAQQTLFYLRDRLYEIARLVKNLPVHIVFTKCDLISGFTPFFANLDYEQRAQTFGLDFTPNKKIHDPSPLFNEQFDQLLQHLYNQLLPRLHQERQLEQRWLLSNFPLQLEALRPFIATVLNKIPSGANINIHGIYFTSSLQEGTPIDYLPLPAKTQPKIVKLPNCSFFTQDLFQKIITPPGKILNKFKLKLHLGYAAVTLVTLGLIFASSIFWYQNYTSNTNLLQLAKANLPTAQALNDFTSLKTLGQQLEAKSNSLWLKLGINKVYRLNANLKQVYQSASASSYLIQVKDAIESELTTANNASAPRKIYNDLKMYLMFANPNKLDPPFVQNWFRTFAATKLNASVATQFQAAADLITQHAVKVKTDPKIIATAQQLLKNMPKEQLAFIFLENQFANTPVTLNTNNNTEIFYNLTFSIPSIYTADSFNRIYNQEIPNLLKHSATNDWVIGNDFKLQFTPEEQAQLITGIRTIYLNNYANAWADALDPNLRLTTAKDIAQVTQQLNAITDTNEPFLKLLKLIKANTSFATAPPELTQLLTSKLNGLTSLDLTGLQTNLNALRNYFETINKSPDVNKAAFSATLSRFQDPTQHDPLTQFQKFAAQQPKPLQTWLQNIASNSWQALFTPTQNYLSAMWQDNVYAQYQKLINAKYPVFKTATVDLSISDFNKFFGPNGVIDSFFTIYLRPFVDTDQVYWTWKTVDGQKLTFAQSSLEIFIRAALIQKMFYGEQTITPSAHFTLTPIAMNPNTQSFSLNLEGQKISYRPGANTVNQLAWPGPVPGKITLEFTNKAGRHFTTLLTGPWAWFKLLAKSNMQSINNSQHFDFTLDLNGNSIKYELISAQPVNPFIPGILEDFRCPSTLSFGVRQNDR